MPDTLREAYGLRILECASDGQPVSSERDATAIIGDAFSGRANWVVIPISRLPDDFFRLRTGIAGAIIQKFANYHLRLAIAGDITDRVAESAALRDFVIEANRGAQLWFVPTADALDQRLARASGSRS